MVEKIIFRAYIDPGGDGRQPPVRKDWRKVRTPQSRESLGERDAGDDTPRKGKRNRKQTAGRKSGKGEMAG